MWAYLLKDSPLCGVMIGQSMVVFATSKRKQTGWGMSNDIVGLGISLPAILGFLSRRRQIQNLRGGGQ